MSAKASTEGPTLDLLIIAYGSSENDPNNDSRFTGENQRRVEVQLAPRIPAELAGNMRRMQSWARDKVHATVLDIKHSQRWHCEFCGARVYAFAPCSHRGALIRRSTRR